jgi:adenylate kinase
MFEKRMGIMPISTGDMFRALMKENTPLARRAGDLINAGHLVTDDITIQMVRDRLKKKDFGKGLIMDGFPRNVVQADAFEKILKDLKITLQKVVFIDVDKDEVVSRLSGRRTCKKCGSAFHVDVIGDSMTCDSCGGELYQRDDDNAKTIRSRLETYDKETLPLKEYYESKEKLVRVVGSGTPEEIYQRIASKL